MLREKEVLFKYLYKTNLPEFEKEFETLLKIGQLLKPYLCDTFKLLKDNRHKNILYEGAQGVLLDNNYGTYPFVTSSNCIFNEIFNGSGPIYSDNVSVTGIAKAYCTRVGEGPFPTELKDKDGDNLAELGHEFGSTTGRPRRCGWLDLPLLKYAIDVSQITNLALTKIDILSKLDSFKVCVGYKYHGEIYKEYERSMDLYEVKPIFIVCDPFKDIFDGEDLSVELINFIKLIEEYIEIPVSLISFGPERNQIKFLKD